MTAIKHQKMILNRDSFFPVVILLFLLYTHKDKKPEQKIRFEYRIKCINHKSELMFVLDVIIIHKRYHFVKCIVFACETHINTGISWRIVALNRINYVDFLLSIRSNESNHRMEKRKAPMNFITFYRWIAFRREKFRAMPFNAFYIL